ncbi:MAG TPA: ribosome-associated translation inhibitor RaiA [Bryobacteraceae bacterium]|nr:ribosome-associated translation inhibitor RaiA [Bryobacteraceae bacterium]
MKIIYSGKTKDFTPELEEKISLKLAKLSKMIERRGEREAHIVHQTERHLHKLEIQVNFYDHALIGEGEDADLAIALHSAFEKIEKQIVKLRARWRDTHRDPKNTRTVKENQPSEPLEVPAGEETLDEASNIIPTK